MIQPRPNASGWSDALPGFSSVPIKTCVKDMGKMAYFRCLQVWLWVNVCLHILVLRWIFDSPPCLCPDWPLGWAPAHPVKHRFSQLLSACWVGVHSNIILNNVFPCNSGLYVHFEIFWHFLGAARCLALRPWGCGIFRGGEFESVCFYRDVLAALKPELIINQSSR